MKQSDHGQKRARFWPARIGGAVGLLLALFLLLASPASASYEQVGTFGSEVFGEGSLVSSRFYKASGMAVNVGGVGGVPAGTVYVAKEGFDVIHENESTSFIGLATYSPKGEFLGEWGSFPQAQGVAVDQSTGNVYVLLSPAAGQDSVLVYTPDGSKLIASFGERGSSAETVDESPEKVHRPSNSGIAVDSSGVVYVSDLPFQPGKESRIMVFEPQSPGDYEHYVYAGRAQDIGVGTPYIEALALDSTGNLYTVSEEVAIYEFAPGEPVTPVCEFQLPTGGIEGMTVNSESGEVFYFTFKTATKIHQLSACNPQGEFLETGTFVLTPKAPEIDALAFNPALAYEASRPFGILYAADRASSKNAHGDIFAPAEAFPPVVESESVSSVTSTTATLGAEINPKGSETRYAFQYITEAAYQANKPAERFAGSTEAPPGGTELGSGQSPLGAGVSLVGLQPDTEYRYRVIATSHCDPEDEGEVCEDVGDAQAFRTFPVEAPDLPDGRAWELVSPAQKYGGEVIPADPSTASCFECKPGGNGAGSPFPMQSAPDGEAVVYQGFPFSPAEGAAQFNEYISRRTASGWQTTFLSPSLLRIPGTGHKAFNSELTRGIIYQTSPSLSPEAPAGYTNLYTQGTANPLALSPLLGFEPPNRPAGGLRLTFAGASADFSQLFFEANDALTEETPFAPEALDPGPGTTSSRPMNLYESVDGQLRLVNVLPGNAEAPPGAVFGSGERLSGGNFPRLADFSHAISDDGARVFWSDEAGQVYVRENAESTRAIPDLGKFLTASADGSKVLLNNGHLYDLETETTTDLTEGEGGFKGIAGQGEDLSRIYFVDTAVLSGEEENDHGAKAQAGENNLYAWQGGAAVFIATLLPGDNAFKIEDRGGDWIASPQGRTAEASPDGRWVAFLSRRALTGYDNSGTCALKADGKKEEGVNVPCSEVFLYDSDSGELTCPSCNPSGARPLGLSMLRLIKGAEGSLPQPRYLTDEGRLYFDTQDSLTPFDTNNGVEDVYQYEPEGVGSCKREGGCVNLISAGHEPVDSNLLAVDATGKNVFFTTRDQLVLKDRDELIDLYVAREGGGIAAETETARGECQGEACRPAVVVPNDPTPSTSNLEGAGNVVEKKATKKAKRKKRKQRAKKRRHKRAHGRAANRNRGGAR